MGFQNSCKREDLKPNSRVFLFLFLFLFSKVPNHLNTSYGTLFEAALMDQVLEHKAISVLNLWQNVSIVKNDQTPIFIAVKSTQMVFNGSGAQETCDMLVEALVYLTMPTASLRSNEDIWTHFKNMVISYQKEHVSVALATGSISVK